MSFWLSLYDVTGIQDFIFASNKAKENVGASQIVDDVLSTMLRESIEDEKVALTNVVCDWQAQNSFQIEKDASIDAEIVYIGGGNALVAYKKDDFARAVTKLLSLKILEATGGTLSVAVAHVPATTDFLTDWRCLRAKLEACKYRLPNGMPVWGLGVTAEYDMDGQPVWDRSDEDGQWLSYAAIKKRAAANDGKDKFSAQFLTGRYSSHFNFPLQFDNLGRQTGNSFIGIVHIDGNGMGKRLEDRVKCAKSYSEAVSLLRAASTAIAAAYKRAFAEITEELAHIFAEREEYADFVGMFNLDRESLPLRPLIFAGDDVTFVCDGRIAIDLAVNFVERINKAVFTDGKAYWACAGIAIVKPHYPFWRAYELAEALCQSAKARSKRYDDKKGCWIDYQIVYSGLPADLMSYRENKYSVAGTKNPKPEQGKFTLLWRPYCVISADEDQITNRYKWGMVKTNITVLKDGDEQHKMWPHSRLKGLREALCESFESAESYYDECKSRGLYLPSVSGKADRVFENREPQDIPGSKHTRWYDVLELEDVYLHVPWPGGVLTK